MISALIISSYNSLDVKRVQENFSFVDEIIIAFDIDNFNILEHESENMVVLKFSNIEEALSNAKNKWVLVCRPDDIFNEALQNELKIMIGKAVNSIYSIKRKFFFMGSEIKRGGYLSAESCLFFDKDLWDETSSRINLNNLYVQKSYEGFDAYNKSISLKSIEEANVLFKSKLRPNLYHLILKPFILFLNRYILNLGFLDGKEGFILAYLSAFGIFKKYIHLWTSYRNIN